MDDEVEDKMDKLMEEEKKETERINAMLDSIDYLIRLSNKRDQVETLIVLLIRIKEETRDSPDLLEFSKENLIKRIEPYIK